jgi:hypothetical protein
VDTTEEKALPKEDNIEERPAVATSMSEGGGEVLGRRRWSPVVHFVHTSTAEAQLHREGSHNVPEKQKI